MWLKIIPDMELNMEVELRGVDKDTRDYDMQLYETTVRDALKDRLKKVFAEEDIIIYAVDVGVAREKYVRRKAA